MVARKKNVDLINILSLAIQLEVQIVISLKISWVKIPLIEATITLHFIKLFLIIIFILRYLHRYDEIIYFTSIQVKGKNKFSIHFVVH